MIRDAFAKAKDRPFEISAPDQRHVFVSSPTHIKEIDTASPKVLSLFVATKRMLQPQYTMHGFNWPNIRGSEGLGFIKALRTILTNNLPSYIPKLNSLIFTELSKIFSQAQDHGAGKKIAIYEKISRVTALANAYTFFGESLAFNEEFMYYASTTTEATFTSAEVLRLLPRWMQGFAGKVVKRLSTSQAGMYRMLMSTVEERLNEKASIPSGRMSDLHVRSPVFGIFCFG